MKNKKNLKRKWLALSLLMALIVSMACRATATETVSIPLATATFCVGTDCAFKFPPTSPIEITPLLSPTIRPGAQKTAQVVNTLSPRPTLTPPACSGGSCSHPTVTPVPTFARIPVFSHVILILLENHEYPRVVGDTQMMPNFNRWIKQYALLTSYYAVAHPSLPNYLALIGGDTFGIQTDCYTCFVKAPSLPDEIEAAGLTWKDYQEDMPAPCSLGHNGKLYTQAINPFVYFDPIRLNKERCNQNVLPLTRLDQDLSQGSLPDFVFITPNLCNDGHRCELSVTDVWLTDMVGKLMSSTAYNSNSLIVITFDEGSTDASCCGLGRQAGGHIATLLISPLVKTGFEDKTPYSHYSLLKTIETSWGLPLLGHAADAITNLISAPWGQ
jgi:hypothetical protein